jgi:hypothetical protein
MRALALAALLVAPAAAQEFVGAQPVNVRNPGTDGQPCLAIAGATAASGVVAMPPSDGETRYLVNVRLNFPGEPGLPAALYLRAACLEAGDGGVPVPPPAADATPRCVVAHVSYQTWAEAARTHCVSEVTR